MSTLLDDLLIGIGAPLLLGALYWFFTSRRSRTLARSWKQDED